MDLFTGKYVAVEVVENPDKLGFGRSQLIDCFGEKSNYNSELTIIHLEQNSAHLKMETCSGDTLLYSNQSTMTVF